MKKFIAGLLFLIAVSSNALAQTNPQTVTRIRDATGITTYANVGQLSLSLPTTTYALAVEAGVYFYDVGTTQLYRMHGEALDAAIAATAPVAPFVGAYGLFWNGTTIQRLTGEAIDDNMTAAPVWSGVAAYQTFYDLAGMQRRTSGEAYDSSMTAVPTNPNVNSFGVFYNGTVSQYLQGSILSGETVADTTYAPHGKNFVYGHDTGAATWRYVHTVDQQADNLSTATNGLVTSSVLYGYSAAGGDLDLLRLGTSSELYVTDIASRPGEDAVNDWVDVQKRETYAPAAVTKVATAIDTNLTTVMDAKVVVQDVNWCVYVKNVGGGGAASFSDVQVQSSPNNSDWTADLGWTGCDTAASGVACSYCVNGSAYYYIRVQAKVGAGSTTVTTWYFANKN